MDERFTLQAANASAARASAPMDFDVLDDDEMVNSRTLLAAAPAEAGQ